MKKIKIGIIRLGYVGLPLAEECGKKYPSIGFDINQIRIKVLQGCNDITLETSLEELKQATILQFTDLVDDLHDCNIYIATIPTPINSNKQPDLTPFY